jgi:hypothetical protein
LRNEDDYGLHVAQNLLSRDSKRADALRSQPSIAALVALRVVAHVVHLAINLDAERSTCAIEIQGVRAGRVLLAEFVPARAFAQGGPEQDFRQAHLATKPP